MKFENTTEAFNYWNKRSIQEIEERSAQINGIIDNDPNADVTSINIEVEGLNEAYQNKKEIQDSQTQEPNTRSLNPIAHTNFDASKTQTPEQIVSSKEYRNAFYKSLMGKEMNLKEKAIFKQAQAEFRADQYNSSANSGAVLPTETLNEVVSKAREKGGLISVARSFSIPSNISIPIGTPSKMAKWNDEGQDVEREKVSLDTVKFDGYEIIKVFSISNKVKTMSIPAFESYLTDELANCVMATIEDGLINGTGVNQGTGLLTGINWNGYNSFETDTDNVEYTDITRAVSMLKRGYSNGAVFLMNNATLYKNVYGIVDNNKRPIFVLDPKNESIGRLLGYEVVVDDFLPNDVIIFGNPQYMGYNLPEGITVESSTQSSFTSGKVDYRAMAIADCKPIIDEAFVKITINPYIEEQRDLKLSNSGTTTPETVDGVSVEWEVKDNKLIATYTGLKDEPVAGTLTNDLAILAESKHYFSTEVSGDKLTFTFGGAIPKGQYTAKAMVLKDKKYKTVSQTTLTIGSKGNPILNGSPIVISND